MQLGKYVGHMGGSMRKWALIASTCLFVSACGDGGSTGGSVSVVPGGSSSAPTPTPTASPTPTATLNTGELKPSPDATFMSATMDLTMGPGATNSLTGRTTGGTTTNRLITLNTPGFGGSYNSATGYSLFDASNKAAFGANELISDTTSTDKIYPTVLFSKVASPVEDYLALYKEYSTTATSSAVVVLTPKYGGVGGWQHTIASSSSKQTRLNYFAFGSPTPLSAMPKTGVVKFWLVGSGNYAGDNDLWFTNQGDNITVDFGSGTINARLTVSGRNFYADAIGGLFAVAIKATIDGNGATGPTSSSVAVASGSFRLAFIGPNADEVLVTYVGQDGRGSYVGSSVGVRSP